MTAGEFAYWLGTLVERRRLTSEQADDLRQQRELFDADRERIEQEFAGRVVGFVNEELLVRDGVTEMLSAAVGHYDGQRQLYYEPIAPRMNMLTSQGYDQLEVT